MSTWFVLDWWGGGIGGGCSGGSIFHFLCSPICSTGLKFPLSSGTTNVGSRVAAQTPSFLKVPKRASSEKSGEPRGGGGEGLQE